MRKRRSAGNATLDEASMTDEGEEEEYMEEDQEETESTTFKIKVRFILSYSSILNFFTFGDFRSAPGFPD